MEHSELTISISADSAIVSLQYNVQQYIEKWSRIGKGDIIHMESMASKLKCQIH